MSVKYDVNDGYSSCEDEIDFDKLYGIDYATGFNEKDFDEAFSESEDLKKSSSSISADTDSINGTTSKLKGRLGGESDLKDVDGLLGASSRIHKSRASSSYLRGAINYQHSLDSDLSAIATNVMSAYARAFEEDLHRDSSRISSPYMALREEKDTLTLAGENMLLFNTLRSVSSPVHFYELIPDLEKSVKSVNNIECSLAYLTNQLSKSKSLSDLALFLNEELFPPIKEPHLPTVAAATLLIQQELHEKLSKKLNIFRGVNFSNFGASTILPPPRIGRSVSFLCSSTSKLMELSVSSEVQSLLGTHSSVTHRPLSLASEGIDARNYFAAYRPDGSRVLHVRATYVLSNRTILFSPKPSVLRRSLASRLGHFLPHLRLETLLALAGEAMLAMSPLSCHGIALAALDAALAAPHVVGFQHNSLLQLPCRVGIGRGFHGLQYGVGMHIVFPFVFDIIPRESLLDGKNASRASNDEYTFYDRKEHTSRIISQKNGTIGRIVVNVVQSLHVGQRHMQRTAVRADLNFFCNGIYKRSYFDPSSDLSSTKSGLPEVQQYRSDTDDWKDPSLALFLHSMNKSALKVALAMPLLPASSSNSAVSATLDWGLGLADAATGARTDDDKAYLANEAEVRSLLTKVNSDTNSNLNYVHLPRVTVAKSLEEERKLLLQRVLVSARLWADGARGLPARSRARARDVARWLEIPRRRYGARQLLHVSETASFMDFLPSLARAPAELIQSSENAVLTGLEAEEIPFSENDGSSTVSYESKDSGVGVLALSAAETMARRRMGAGRGGASGSSIVGSIGGGSSVVSSVVAPSILTDGNGSSATEATLEDRLVRPSFCSPHWIGSFYPKYHSSAYMTGSLSSDLESENSITLNSLEDSYENPAISASSAASNTPPAIQDQSPSTESSAPVEQTFFVLPDTMDPDFPAILSSTNAVAAETSTAVAALVQALNAQTQCLPGADSHLRPPVTADPLIGLLQFYSASVLASSENVSSKKEAEEDISLSLSAAITREPLPVLYTPLYAWGDATLFPLGTVYESKVAAGDIGLSPRKTGSEGKTAEEESRNAINNVGKGNLVVHRPSLIPVASDIGLLRITSIACGRYHTIACTDTGAVFTWGNGGDGQLGNGYLRSQAVPKLVEFFGFQNAIFAVSVAAGSDDGGSHSLVLGRGLMAEEVEKFKERRRRFLRFLKRSENTDVTQLAESGKEEEVGAGLAQFKHADRVDTQLAEAGEQNVDDMDVDEDISGGNDVDDDASSASSEADTAMTLLSGVSAPSTGKKSSKASNRSPLSKVEMSYYLSELHDPEGLLVAGTGRVYAFGLGSALGVGSAVNSLTPKLVSPPPLQCDINDPLQGGVVSISAGAGCSLARTAAGAVYTWGAYRDGRLGLGAAPLVRSGKVANAKDRLRFQLTPQRIVGGLVATASFSTESTNPTADSTAAVSSDTPTPSNSSKLGLYDYFFKCNGSSTSSPNPFGPPTVRAVDASLGAAHGALVDTFGLLYSWGNGSNGEQGVGSLSSSSRPHRVPVHCYMRVDSLNISSLGSSGDVPSSERDRSQSVGSINSLESLLEEQLQLTPAGISQVKNNEKGQKKNLRNRKKQEQEQELIEEASASVLNIQKTPVRFTRVICGPTHTVAISTTGALFSWGGGGAFPLGCPGDARNSWHHQTPLSALVRRSRDARLRGALVAMKKQARIGVERGKSGQLGQAAFTQEDEEIDEQLRQARLNGVLAALNGPSDDKSSTGNDEMKLDYMNIPDSEIRANNPSFASLSQDVTLAYLDDSDTDEEDTERAGVALQKWLQRRRALKSGGLIGLERALPRRRKFNTQFARPARVEAFAGDAQDARGVVVAAGGGYDYSFAVSAAGELFLWGHPDSPVLSGLLGVGGLPGVDAEKQDILRAQLTVPHFVSSISNPAALGAGPASFVAAALMQAGQLGMRLRTQSPVFPLLRPLAAYWEDQSVSLLGRMHNRLNSSTFDAILVVENRFLPAHRVVLSARSARLRALLEGPSHRIKVLDLPDISFAVAALLLDFIYSDSLNSAVAPTAMVLADLGTAADRYGLPRLAALCAVQINAPINYWIRQIGKAEKSNGNIDANSEESKAESEADSMNMLIAPAEVRKAQLAAATYLATKSTFSLKSQLLDYYCEMYEYLKNANAEDREIVLSSHFVDVLLISKEKIVFPCHSLILSAVSPFFADIATAHFSKSLQHALHAMTPSSASIMAALALQGSLGKLMDGWTDVASTLEIELSDSAVTIARLLAFSYSGSAPRISTLEEVENFEFCGKIRIPYYFSEEFEGSRQSFAVPSDWNSSTQLMADLVACERYEVLGYRSHLEGSLLIQTDDCVDLVHIATKLGLNRLREAVLVTGVSALGSIASTHNQENSEYLSLFLARSVCSVDPATDSTMLHQLEKGLHEEKKVEDGKLVRILRDFKLPVAGMALVFVLVIGFFQLSKYNTALNVLVPVINVGSILAMGFMIYKGMIRL